VRYKSNYRVKRCKNENEKASDVNSRRRRLSEATWLAINVVAAAAAADDDDDDDDIGRGTEMQSRARLLFQRFYGLLVSAANEPKRRLRPRMNSYTFPTYIILAGVVDVFAVDIVFLAG